MGFIEVRTLLQIEVTTPCQYTKSKYNADGQQHNTVSMQSFFDTIYTAESTRLSMLSIHRNVHAL